VCRKGAEDVLSAPVLRKDQVRVDRAAPRKKVLLGQGRGTIRQMNQVNGRQDKDEK